MAEAPFATPRDWLAEVASFLADRAAALIATHGVNPAAYVASEDALALAGRLRADAGASPLGPEEVRRAARLCDPARLEPLPVWRLIRAYELPGGMALLIGAMLLGEEQGDFPTLWAYLNDDAQRRHLTPALAARLMGPLPLPATILLSEAGPLRTGEIAVPDPDASRALPDRMLRLTDGTAAFLLDDRPAPGRDPALAGFLRAAPQVPSQLIPPGGEPPARGPFVLTGPEGSGRATLAAALAHEAGQEPLVLDGAAVLAAPNPAARLRIALREALLSGGRLVVTGAEGLPRPEAEGLVTHARGALTLVATERLPLDLPHLAVPAPDPARTRALWRHALGPGAEPLADQLAHRFRLPVPDLLAVARRARLAGRAADLAQLTAACLDRSSTALDRLATRLETRHNWDDLVLPERQTVGLRALVGRVTHARQVYDAWGFGRKLAPSRGLTALFTGPSGAGKTLSAGVVARALGLPLYRVDLSATVSKYIGETEKHLEQIFAAAEAGNSVLFFDECDALFGKRSEVTDAHDRYANIETSFLLQRLEAHRGIVILASNHPQNIDEAFARRIDMTVAFPMPDAAARAQLWRRLLPPEAEAAIDADQLGASFELSGGAIRNCLLTAAFLAAGEGTAITTGHCLRAVAQDYEKSGRPLTRHEFGDAFGALRGRRGR